VHGPSGHLGLSRDHFQGNVFVPVGGNKIEDVSSKKEISSAGLAAPRRINRTSRKFGVAPIGIRMFMPRFAGPSEASTSYCEEPR
jgi:hypothetical protein